MVNKRLGTEEASIIRSVYYRSVILYIITLSALNMIQVGLLLASYSIDFYRSSPYCRFFEKDSASFVGIRWSPIRSLLRASKNVAYYTDGYSGAILCFKGCDSARAYNPFNNMMEN